MTDLHREKMLLGNALCRAWATFPPIDLGKVQEANRELAEKRGQDGFSATAELEIGIPDARDAPHDPGFDEVREKLADAALWTWWRLSHDAKIAVDRHVRWMARLEGRDEGLAVIEVNRVLDGARSSVDATMEAQQRIKRKNVERQEAAERRRQEHYGAVLEQDAQRIHQKAQNAKIFEADRRAQEEKERFGLA